MADDHDSQKQISGQYQGNLGYLRHTHYLRRLRLWAFGTVALIAVLGVAGFRYWGKEDVFSLGPISENHAHFASDCQTCHAGVETSVFAGWPAARKTAAIPLATAGLPQALSHPSLSAMDESCLRCHPHSGLHLPQASRLGMSAVSGAVAIVHATGCATCHREHVGTDRMAMPERQSCIDCHNDAEKLRLTPKRVRLSGQAVAKTGENHDLGDGLIRFISPARPPGTLPPFDTYSDRHPPFDYEHPDRLDPARLAFNHARHLRSDLPKVQGQKLDCIFCHKPGPGGTHYQPVSYEAHCQECHTLQIHPDLPNLRVPHGDPEKTRYFLTSLPTMLAKEELSVLRSHGLGTLADLEQRVFGKNDASGKKAPLPVRPGDRTFITECAKCHAVSSGQDGSLPKIELPNIADRWVQHGPFTHLPHLHVACVDCHAEALTSTKTTDILLPPQTLCAECHRPAGRSLAFQPEQSSQLSVSIDSNSLAARQVQQGGVKAECQSCHSFHAPSHATELLETLLKPPQRR